MVFPLTLLLLAAPLEPTTIAHRFVHRLAGAPVGEVELRLTGPRYVYLSRHFFRRGKSSEERFEPESSPGAPEWASLSLLTPRAAGCWPVVAELTLEHGEVCVAQTGPKATGTLLGQPFTARYAHGALQQLTLGDSDFLRSDQPVEFKDPFSEGFEISSEGAVLALTPPLKGMRSATVTGAGREEDCFTAAKAWVAARGPRWELVLGLVEDEGRGWPHAWVKDSGTGEEVDPSRPQRPSRYLALPSDRAAEVYLELLGKRRTLVRVARQ